MFVVSVRKEKSQGGLYQKIFAQNGIAQCALIIVVFIAINSCCETILSVRIKDSVGSCDKYLRR